MKITLLATALLLLSIVSTAHVQKDSDSIKKDSVSIKKEVHKSITLGKNEIKTNLLLYARSMLTLTYERILSDHTGIGLVGFKSYQKQASFNYGAIGYFRFYSGPQRGSGIFMEANVGFSDFYDKYYPLPGSTYANPTYKKYTKMGFGAAAGGKYLFGKGIACEAYIGTSKFLGIDPDDDDYGGPFSYPSVGISIGKRF